MKWEPMQRWAKSQQREHKFFIGIAKDENRKLITPNESLLLNFGITEQGSREICEKVNLLNPMYAYFKRMGCVRCPKQGRKALSIVRELEPEKWDWMLKNDKYSPVSFKPGKTFIQYVERL